MYTIYMILFEFYVFDSEFKNCNISQFCVKWIVCESFHTPQKFADHGIPSLFMVRYSSLHFQLDELISISIFCDRFESRSVPFNLENTYIASIVKKGRIRPPWGQGFFKLHLYSLKKIYLSITFWLTLQLFLTCMVKVWLQWQLTHTS